MRRHQLSSHDHGGYARLITQKWSVPTAAIDMRATATGTRTGCPQPWATLVVLAVDPCAPSGQSGGIMTDNAPSAMNAALSNPKQDMADLDRLERRRFALRYALDEIATLGPSIDPPKATEERAEGLCRSSTRRQRACSARQRLAPCSTGSSPTPASLARRAPPRSRS